MLNKLRFYYFNKCAYSIARGRKQFLSICSGLLKFSSFFMSVLYLKIEDN